MKKRIFTMLAALMAVLAGFTAGAKSYNLWIFDTQVTDENKSDIKNGAIEKGKVWYDSQTNELWLEDFRATGKTTAILSKIPGLTVRTLGSAVVQLQNASCMRIENGSVHFQDCWLTMRSEDKSAIELVGSGITGNFSFMALIGKWSISGETGAATESVKLDRCCAWLHSREASCKNISNFTLENCDWDDAPNVHFDAQQKTLIKNGSVSITTDLTDSPLLYFSGEPVSVGPNGRDMGLNAASFDNTRRILVLKSMISGTENSRLVENYLPGLTITSDQHFTADCSGGIYAGAPTKLERLEIDINCPQGIALYCIDAPLKIENCIINVSATWGLTGEKEKGDSVTVVSSDLKLNAEYGSIADLADFSISGCKITTPEGAAYNPATGNVESGGNIVTNLEITTSAYDVFINGIQVRGSNATGIKGPGIIGKISYIEDLSMLMIDNAVIQGVKAPAISISQPKVTVNFRGNVNIFGSNYGGIIAYQPVLFQDDEAKAKVNITSEGAGISAENTNITISNLNLEVSGRWGITGYDGSKESLTIFDSNVKATGTEGSICDFNSMHLQGCEIIYPANAAFDAVLHGVAVNGALVTETVEIQKGAGVEGVIADEVEDLSAPMFNIMGQQIAQPYNGQIYIRNGRKKVWRE